MRWTRCSRRFSASTVRPPSTVSLTVPASARVRRALPEVARRGALQVPARAHEEHRNADDARQRGEGAHPDRGRDREHRRDRRDQRLGHGEADRAGERVDVGGRPGDEVTRPCALDGRERQPEHAAHEVLAQLGEHLLGQHERGPAREPGQDRLDDEEDREQRRRSCRRARSSFRPGPTGRARRGAPARRGPRWRQPRADRPCRGARAGCGARAGAPASRTSGPDAIGSSSFTGPHPA